MASFSSLTNPGLLKPDAVLKPTGTAILKSAASLTKAG